MGLPYVFEKIFLINKTKNPMLKALSSSVCCNQVYTPGSVLNSHLSTHPVTSDALATYLRRDEQPHMS